MASLIVQVGTHRGILEKLLASAQEIVRVACPYVTDSDLLLRSYAQEVRLLISLSKKDVVVEATSLDSLRVLVESGVKCRVLSGLPKQPKLHAKVYLLDKEYAVITSANLTKSGLDRNIEVGVSLRGDPVAKLIAWFDEHWDSDGTEPLTLPKIENLKKETAELRKRFRKLLRLLPPDASQSTPHKEPKIKIPRPARYFICNTDRRYDREAEKLMEESGFAVAWETFEFTEHIERVKRGDLIFMYANRVGIIAIGRAKGGSEKLSPAEPSRVKQGRTPEWRISVNWLRWWQVENACPWKPPANQTFVDISSQKYAARRELVLKHFRIMPKATV